MTTEATQKSIAESSAQYDAQRVRNEQMILQLKKTEGEIAQQELQAQLQAAQALKAASEARASVPQADQGAMQSAQKNLAEANVAGANVGIKNLDEAKAIAKGAQGNATPQQMAAAQRIVDEQNKLDALNAPVAQADKALNEARANAARVGLPEGMTAEQAQSMIDLNTARGQKATENLSRQTEIDALRIQERYGPDRVASKEKANAIEDQMLKEQRIKELGAQMPDASEEQVQSVAGYQVDIERQMKKIDESTANGGIRMSEMASVGGSAGWAGVVNDPTTEIKNIAKLVEELKAALQTLNDTSKSGLSMAENMKNQMSE